MSLVQINQDMLLDFAVSLRKAAPSIYPENEEEIRLVRQWAKIANYVKEFCEPLSHLPGFDSETTRWTRLESGYRREIQDYDARHKA